MDVLDQGFTSFPHDAIEVLLEDFCLQVQLTDVESLLEEGQQTLHSIWCRIFC